MCDYSLQMVTSRPAAVGDELVTRNFGYGTTGFAPVDDDSGTAVCLLPGTELAFHDPYVPNTGRFRQINRDIKHAHHDAVEFPDGKVVTLSSFSPGIRATVLQLPAAPRNETEAQEQRRAEFAG